VVTGIILFAGYYYLDRYTHPQAPSPVEHGISQLETVVRDNPQDPAARVALAQLYVEKGRYGEAYDQTRQVLVVTPNEESALLIHGVSAAALQRTDQAIVSLEKFTTTRQGKPTAAADMDLETAYYYLGTLYNQQGQSAKALTALEAALAISPTDADALHQAGRAYQALGQAQQAVDTLLRAARLVPDFEEVYGVLVTSYTALSQPDGAAYARGMQAFSRGDLPTAQSQLERATKALPQFAPAFVGLGLTYEKLGRNADALAAFTHASLLDPNDFATQQALGRLQSVRKAGG
jgi:tetratricopeptide (TPR) repeat protein